MADARKAPQAGQAATTESSLLDQIVNTVSTVQEQKGFARDIVAEFVNQALAGAMVFKDDTEKMLKKRIGELDELISAQLNAIMHAPEFQQLEASWRGLKYLVDQTPSRGDLKIKVLNVTKRELLADLKGNDYDQSLTWKKVYAEEFDVFGGDPFGVMVGDFEFGNTPQDIELLEKMATVAAGAHAPFISAASPQMFGLQSMTQIGEPKSIDKIFQGVEYAKWRAFRESEDSKFVGLTTPRMLLRLPYGPESSEVEAFAFREDSGGADHSKYLWGNSAYAFASRVTNSFADYGWCTSIRGVESGGLVEDLPTHTFRTDEGDVAMKCPTEVALSGRREKELADAGFIPLVHYKGRDYAVFTGAQSTNKPKTYNKSDATANARISSQLQYMFASCRFAHFMQAIVRDKVGGYMSRKEAEDFLQTWISQYVLIDDTASMGKKAERPLRAAEVTVEEVPGKPGSYRAVAYLRPHYQLEELDVSLRLVADLPQPANA